jgi:hypothetical protein
MKIIASTGPCLLVEATRDELAKIAGHHSAYGIKTTALEIGAEIRVSEAYEAVSKLRSSPRRVEEIKKLLAEVAEGLTPVKALIEPIEAQLKDVTLPGRDG